MGRSPDQRPGLPGKRPGTRLRPHSRPSSFANALEQAELDFDLSQVASHIDGQTSEDLGIRDIEPVLCTVAPRRMAELKRSLVRCLPDRRGAARELLGMRLFAHLIVMGPEERRIIVDSWRCVFFQRDESNEDSFAETFFFQCALWGSDADTWCNLLRQRTGACNFPAGHVAPAPRLDPTWQTASPTPCSVRAMMMSASASWPGWMKDCST